MTDEPTTAAGRKPKRQNLDYWRSQLADAERCAACRHGRHVGRCRECECWCGHPRAIEAEARREGAAEVLAVIEKVGAWLDEFYAPVEDYGDDYPGMAQIDHGFEEYRARIEVAVAVRTIREAERKKAAENG